MSLIFRKVRELWAAWKRVARRIGDFQARVLLTLFYFLFLSPFAMIVRATGDPLTLKQDSPRGWRPASGSEDKPRERAAAQF